MNIDDRELKSIIRRIAEKVVREALEPETVERGALALTPAFIPDAAPLEQYLKQTYGMDVACAGEGALALSETIRRITAETPQERARLMARLKSFADVLLVCPPLWMLQSIARGDDRGYFEQAAMRALLWHKNVTVLLDFEPPKQGRGTFFEGIGDALKALEEMGAKIVTLKLSVGRPEGELTLVTEADVEAAQKAGKARVRCAPGAIVTPLADDAARQLGVAIED